MTRKMYGTAIWFGKRCVGKIFLTYMLLGNWSCISVPPMPEELKHVVIVNGWNATADLESRCTSVRTDNVRVTYSDPYRAQARAVELKANVAQHLLDRGSESTYRFWDCTRKHDAIEGKSKKQLQSSKK